MPLDAQGNRETYSDAPWLDHHGFEQRLDEACRDDPQGWSNWKRGLVEAYDHNGRPNQRWIVTTARASNGTITSFLERIDEFGRPVRVIVPHKVIQRIEQQVTRLQAENKSRKARESTPPAN